MKADAKDSVQVRDALYFNNRLWAGPAAETVQVKGFFSAVCRERGKLVYGSRREGFNIWTLTGREYLAQLMSYASYTGPTPVRDDHVRYIGFGTGTQPEVAAVSALVQPIEWNQVGDFLAELQLPTYPLTPTLTTVRYGRTYTELQLSVAGTVTISEAGLFTDGDPLHSYQQLRDPSELGLAQCGGQPPMAYKSFEQLKKTQNFVLETAWEIRF